MLADGITWFSETDRDAFGWTAYTPLTDLPRRYADYAPSDGFSSTETISLIAFCLLVLAALVEAVAAGRVLPGITTIAIPFATATLIWYALPRGHETFTLAPIPALFVILMAVAIRELWERRFAPTVTPVPVSEN